MQTGNLGNIALNPKGEWDEDQYYERLDLVTHEGSAYIAKRNIVPGIEPGASDLWMLFIPSGVNATEEAPGIARIATAEEVLSGVDNTTIITPLKLASALKKISGIPLGVIVPIGVNFPAPEGFVNVSYSQPSYHPVAGMAADFVAAYYCGDDRNATADFGYRCDSLDGSGRNPAGAYIAIEPAANRFYRGMDDTGTRDPYMLHSDAIRELFWRLHWKSSGGADFVNTRTITTGGGSSDSSGSGPTIVELYASDQVPTGDRVVPEHIDKKFIMKVADGAIGDPALVDWQAWFDKWTEFSASAVKYADFTGSNQLFLGSGYQKLPGGLILQWAAGANMSVAASQSATQTITLPIAFPNAPLEAFISLIPIGGYGLVGFVGSQTRTGINVQVSSLPSVGAGSVIPKIFAIGY